MIQFSENELKKWRTVRYVSSFDGEKLYTETYQRTSKPTVTHIILHGLGGSSQSTLLLVNEIIKHFPTHAVIIYDLRGHGLSSIKYIQTPEIDSIEEYHAHDLESLIQFFKPLSLTLWGHSFGGIIIQAWHNHFPNNSKTKIILLNSYSQLDKLRFINRQKCFDLLQKYCGKKYVPYQTQFKEDYQFATTRDLNFSRIFHNDLKTMGKINFILSYLSVLGWENIHKKNLDQPNIIFVYGNKDLLIKKPWQQNFMKQLSQATLKIMPCNHHQIMATHFNELVSLIRQTHEKNPH